MSAPETEECCLYCEILTQKFIAWTQIFSFRLTNKESSTFSFLINTTAAMHFLQLFIFIFKLFLKKKRVAMLFGTYRYSTSSVSIFIQPWHMQHNILCGNTSQCVVWKKLHFSMQANALQRIGLETLSYLQVFDL